MTARDRRDAGSHARSSTPAGQHHASSASSDRERAPERRAVDPLGDALRVVRFSGACYRHRTLGQRAALLLPALPRGLWFHLVLEGHGVRETGHPASDAVSLGAGDVVLVAPWTVQRLARAAVLSRLAFAASAGKAPMQHVARVRMLRATTLLSTTDDPIAAIAATCGYDSVAAVSRAVARLEGCSSGALRRVR